MQAKTPNSPKHQLPFIGRIRQATLVQLMLLICLISLPVFAQKKTESAKVNTTLSDDGTGSIIVEAHGVLPKATVFYTATANATARIGSQYIEQNILLSAKIIQGDAKTLSFGLNGSAEVSKVTGENLLSWSIRQEGEQRFLDLRVKKNSPTLQAYIITRSAKLKIPLIIDLSHISPGESVGFNSSITLHYNSGITGTVTAIKGFKSLKQNAIFSGKTSNSFQTTTGGLLQLSLHHGDASPAPVELIQTTLKGALQPKGKSVNFQLRSLAQVSKAPTEITILSGSAALSQLPNSPDYQVRLSSQKGAPVYKLIFSKTGNFPLQLDFVAKVISPSVNSHQMDFTIASSAVVPLTLTGLSKDLEFKRAQPSVVPLYENKNWIGFLPATGRANLQWKSARKTGEGKLFFTTTAQVDAKVGAGLLRQDHQITYKVLQGELKSLKIKLHGPGEILDVQGSNIVAWKVSGEGEQRQLTTTLSQAITSASQIHIRSQTPLEAFPLRVEGLRLQPEGAIRHSGYLRITNLGSVRLEPAELSGLTQLSPEQFPDKGLKARQIFVYRFPSADHRFEIAADRIQPEVNISQLLIYQLAPTDRVIKADIELDIREAAIREWDFDLPADYSVVAVTGTAVADYIAASEVKNERRNLKVIFAKDVAGRQLVSLQLEKNQAAAAGDWSLPPIKYPGAKSVRGNIGIVGAPGFRIAVGETDLLVEKPLSYFPKTTPNLQQSFRIREPAWSATMKIELLARSVQADVFHLYSLSDRNIYASTLLNYFVTGVPVSEWRITVPQNLGNVMVDGQDVRTWRREEDTLIVSLHQAVMGPYTLLVSFEEKSDGNENGIFKVGQVTPLDVQGERGYIQLVSPTQVQTETVTISEDLLKLDSLELPAELRLLSAAPSLGTWQYTQRPFELDLKVSWFAPGSTVSQVVEFSEANSRVSKDGELVTQLLYYVKSRGQRALKIKLPPAPVRLWEVSVNQQAVTARQSDDGSTLIPLPGGTDPNVPVEVRLRLGKPAVDASRPQLSLPIVFAPVLKTEWQIIGDDKRVLVPGKGKIKPPVPVLRPSGFHHLAKGGLGDLIVISFFTLIGIITSGKKGTLRLLGLLTLGIAIFIAFTAAISALRHSALPAPLQLSLPILSAGESIDLQVKNLPLWLINISYRGLGVLLLGIIAFISAFITANTLRRAISFLLIALGTLMQGDSAPYFFALLAIALLFCFFLPQINQWSKDRSDQKKQQHKKAQHKKQNISSESATGTSTAIITLALFILSSLANPLQAQTTSEFKTADLIQQQWQIQHKDHRLKASGSLTLSGRPGDRFLLLKAPATLTSFQGKGLRLSKRAIADQGLTYIVSIPFSEKTPANDDPFADEIPAAAETSVQYHAKFEFQVEEVHANKEIPVLTGNAAVQEIQLSYDETGWDVISPKAVRIESLKATEGNTLVKVLLGPGSTSLFLSPKARDVTMEKTQFFVEASNLYLPGPGVVDGRHRIHIRSAQGQVNDLQLMIPKGLTVSEVSGPIGDWQFDADNGQLKLEIEPAQSATFDIMIHTQRGLDPLPADIKLAPLKVVAASGEIGLVAIAFGPDAQPEKSQSATLSTVNLSDFDSSLLPNKQSVLHRVYRYGAEGGELNLRVAAVDPEVRVSSKQVLSLGDERVLLAVNFAVEITRAGLFQLSFPLPEGLEVESLTGAALHHWAELSDGDQRRIILHLNGKTIGTQNFYLSLTGASPSDAGDWKIPHFELQEAKRQTGELVVTPTTGIRLRTVSRQNISETDPRNMGGKGQGTLAFRLLQRDWNLVLGIEKLDPWITGQVLHEVTLREGQTRSSLNANFTVKNASIRSLQIELPIFDEDQIKTLRANGTTVSDLIRTAPDSNIWQLQFKRRVLGKIQFQIEYERRGDRENNQEQLSPANFPQARQMNYYFAVRPSGRLEVSPAAFPQGWQHADWNTVPQILRIAGNRNAPALSLRTVASTSALALTATRHSLADTLKLRVAKGSLTTVLSPTGDQLTAVDVTMDVIQRSSFSVGLPQDGELFSIFVNDESVHFVRQNDRWQFYILPGSDDRTANVRFVYSVPGEHLKKIKLLSPLLSVPLENIAWNVIAPKGLKLTDHHGNLELKRQSYRQNYDRSSYLSITSGKRKVKAKQTAQLLEQANQLLQSGQQGKARWALNSVANRYALDAASNEDARVQLENLQTQQAIVGLNTRRQRLLLDNKINDTDSGKNQQLKQAADGNQILQQGLVNFHPQQLSQLLMGNSSEDNAMLQQVAGQLVKHQRNTEPAPQAITLTLPEEGSSYTFTRSVQVTQNAPLELNLSFGSQSSLQLWRRALVLALLIALATALTFTRAGWEKA